MIDFGRQSIYDCSIIALSILPPKDTMDNQIKSFDAPNWTELVLTSQPPPLHPFNTQLP